MSTSQTTDQVHGEGVDEVTTLANPRSRKRSRVWEFFKELPDEGKAICIYCQSKLSYQQGLGVSHLRRHILTGCQEFPSDIDRKSIFPVSEPVGDARGFVVDPAVVRDFMNKFWITANLAFRKIENGFFKKMMKAAHPSLEVHGRKTVKKDCVAVYEEEKKKIKSTGDDFLKGLCKDMKAKYDKYWDKPNKVLLVASLLDPRYKIFLLKFGCTKSYGEDVAEQRVAEVRKWFKEYYEYYELMMQTSSQRNTINSSPEVGGSANMLPMLTGKRKLELEFALFKQQHRPNRSRRSEVDIYLEDPLVPLREGESFDVLKWWKRNSEQYPILGRMARDFLAIPLSSVASESTFSTAGMIINQHRSSLNPETAEGLICSKDWLKEYLSDEEDDDDD